jgi:hypothetical protein
MRWVQRCAIWDDLHHASRRSFQSDFMTEIYSGTNAVSFGRNGQLGDIKFVYPDR